MATKKSTAAKSKKSAAVAEKPEANLSLLPAVVDADPVTLDDIEAQHGGSPHVINSRWQAAQAVADFERALQEQPTPPARVLPTPTKMEAAGLKAAAKATQTERASFELIFSPGVGGDDAARQMWGRIKVRAQNDGTDVHMLSLARALRTLESDVKTAIGEDADKAREALRYFTALFTAEKPSAGVGPSVPRDPTRAVVKEAKTGRYLVIRLTDDSTLRTGQAVTVKHHPGGGFVADPIG
jgi:hypothetical protein